MKTISCIIPAYNEEKSIRHTLEVVTPLLGTVLHEIIVVNDASHDGTAAIIADFPHVTLITNSVNQGKSRSVALGIAAATGAYIFLLDADLLFLTAQNITDLIAPIESGVADFSISYRKNAWPLWPFTQIDYLSGERIIARELMVAKLERLSQLKSYGLEVFINCIVIEHALRIQVIHWPNVENDFHQNKAGWIRGSVKIIGIWNNVLSVVSPVEMYRQNLKLRKLLVT